MPRRNAGKSRKPLKEDDDAAACCAAMICCDRKKAIRALALFLQKRSTLLTPIQAIRAATVIHDSFALVPRGHGLEDLIDYVHEHPYD